MSKDPKDTLGSTQPRSRTANHTSNSLHPLLDRQGSFRGNVNSPQLSLGLGLGLSSSSSNVNNKRKEAERAALRQRMRKDIQRQQNEMRRHKEFLEKTKLWEEQILPNWEQLQHTSKVRDLCIKGIPPTIRAKVWPLLLGNELEIDEALFDALNREVQETLGHKMTAHKGKLASSYTSGISFDETQPVGGQTPPLISLNRPRPPPEEPSSSASADIPIPVAGEFDGLDITEMPWFENERSGSLDASDFNLVQRQLLDRPNYLLQRAMLSPGGKNKKANSQVQVGSVDSVGSGGNMPTPLGAGGDPNLSAPFALDADEASAPSTPFVIQKPSSYPPRVPKTSGSPPLPSLKEEMEAFHLADASTPEKSPKPEAGTVGEQYTPPRREKHNPDYLINAGLLVERQSDSLLVDIEADESEADTRQSHVLITQSILSRELQYSQDIVAPPESAPVEEVVAEEPQEDDPQDETAVLVSFLSNYSLSPPNETFLLILASD